MIYLKNNTEAQAIYIPRQTVLGGGYIPSTKAYDKGYNDGLEDGKEQQKGKLSNLNVTENGQYEREDGWNVVNVDLPDLNGSYNEGYEQGKTEGIDEQKAKLESINITENGVYSKEDGYNHIEVNVPDLNGSYEEGYRQGHTEGYAEGNGVGYNQGRIDGIDEQKGKLSQITISENGTYSKEDGYNEVVVNVSDLNGSYDEGKTDGVNEQKSKLETINITENGTYNREDGYNKIIVKVPDLNGSYDEGYNQGQADAAANARVLNVTENGNYLSKFSDPIMPTLITGIYTDGTEFYNYAELNGDIFNTKIAATVDSRLEFWYKGYKTLVSDPTYNLIIGAGNNDDRNCFQVRYYKNSNKLYVDIGRSRKIVNNWDDTVWHHLIVSKAEGLWIDGEKKGDFTASNPIDGEFFINGISYDFNKNANGKFGMVKIDDVVFIPTADGFQNVNTGELLEVVQGGRYTFTENLPTYAEGELYKTINVNVPQEVVSCNLEDKSVTPSTNDVDDNSYIVINPDNGYDAMSRVTIDVSTIKSEWTTIGKNSITDYDITAFTYKVYDWTSVNINRDNMTNDCGDRPLDCLLFRNRSGECTVMTKLDNCSGTARLESGWNGDNIILSLKSNSITKFSSNSINSNRLTSIDTGFAKLEGNAITNCNALTDIKVTVLNDDLSTQFATNCFNGLPAEGTITISKNVDVTITDDEITSFFRTIVGEGWTITIKQ